MMDTFLQELIKRKWMILGCGSTAALVALVVSLVLPKEYLSQASLLPSNSKLMDKQRLFGQNIQELYSAYGNAEDLDRLYATMHSATVIHAVADSLNLSAHYDLDGKKNGKAIAQKKLEKNIKLQRTEYGELNLRVWDREPARAEQIANALIRRTQQVFDEMYRAFYERSMSSMQQELNADSSGNGMLRNRIREMQFISMNAPPAFFVMEKPYASTEAYRPMVLLNVLVAFLAAVFTVVLWIRVFCTRP
jgi:capsular polysaccharide biosynthesis protein